MPETRLPKIRWLRQALRFPKVATQTIKMLVNFHPLLQLKCLNTILWIEEHPWQSRRIKWLGFKSVRLDTIEQRLVYSRKYRSSKRRRRGEGWPSHQNRTIVRDRDMLEPLHPWPQVLPRSPISTQTNNNSQMRSHSAPHKTSKISNSQARPSIWWTHRTRDVKLVSLAYNRRWSSSHLSSQGPSAALLSNTIAI